MSKILYSLNGKQILIEVGSGGGVTSDASILWDERLHGSIPNIELGKMECYDELEDVVPDQFIPEYDEDGNVVLDEENNIVFSDVKVQVLVHKLRVLPDIIESHAQKLAEEAQLASDIADRAYLASTDWLIIREMDSGDLCPVEIKAERAACRSRLS